MGKGSRALVRNNRELMVGLGFDNYFLYQHVSKWFMYRSITYGTLILKLQSKLFLNTTEFPRALMFLVDTCRTELEKYIPRSS
jgi:hypothetical protein